MKASSKEEIESIMNNDPGVINKVFNFKVEDFSIGLIDTTAISVYGA